MPTVVNDLDVDSLHNYLVNSLDNITVNVIAVGVAVAVANNYRNAIRGQFDSGADASVNNVLIYFHNYSSYTKKLKYPVKLTSTVGTKDLYLLGEDFMTELP